MFGFDNDINWTVNYTFRLRHRNTNIAFIELYTGIFKVNLALLAYQ